MGSVCSCRRESGYRHLHPGAPGLGRQSPFSFATGCGLCSSSAYIHRRSFRVGDYLRSPNAINCVWVLFPVPTSRRRFSSADPNLGAGLYAFVPTIVRRPSCQKGSTGHLPPVWVLATSPSGASSPTYSRLRAGITCRCMNCASFRPTEALRSPFSDNYCPTHR